MNFVSSHSKTDGPNTMASTDSRHAQLKPKANPLTIFSPPSPPLTGLFHALSALDKSLPASAANPSSRTYRTISLAPRSALW